MVNLNQNKVVNFNWNYMVNLNWNEVVNIAGISTLYAFMYKKYSNQNEKLKRILYTSLYSLIVIFLWVVIEIFEQQMNVFLWDIQLIKNIVFKSDMRMGLCCFVPISFLVSYFFDKSINVNV